MGEYFEAMEKSPVLMLFCVLQAKLQCLLNLKYRLYLHHICPAVEINCLQIMTSEIRPGYMKTLISPLLSTLDVTSDQYIGCIIRNSSVQLEIVPNR